MITPQNIIAKYPIINNHKNIWVAYSGGIDSHVLLHCMHAIKRDILPNLNLYAIHINHGLQKEAGYWENFCAKTCQILQIPFYSEKVVIQRPKKISLEDVARQVRYSAIGKYLSKGDLLVTAHHADDQAETLLLRLIRGSGVKGLSAIKALRTNEHYTLLRPFILYSRQNIEEYAKKHHLGWIEDLSNDYEEFDRNYLRKNIMPLFKKRWPEITKTFLRTISHMEEAESLLKTIAKEDLVKCITAVNRLSVSALKQFSYERCKNIIREFLINLKFILPSTKKLEHIIKDVIHSRQDKSPEILWNNYLVRRFNKELYFMHISYVVPDLTHMILPINLNSTYLELPYQLGSLKISKAPGKGIAIPNQAKLYIVFRKGGEKFKPLGSLHNKKLKKLFNEWRIPPWQRNKIPLLYCDDTLVWVIGYCINDDYRVKTTENGWVIDYNMLGEFTD